MSRSIKKQKLLLTSKKRKTDVKEVIKQESDNAFINAGLSESNLTTSENGAVKLKSTGSPFVDQFGKLTEYINQRSMVDIFADQDELWKINPLLTIKFTLFLRTISRKVNYNNKTTEESQKGGELKNEPLIRMLWLGYNHPSVFMNNLQLFIYLGSWKDVFELMTFDLESNGWKDRKLPWSFLYRFIYSGLNDKSQKDLVIKYLPQIKSSGKNKSNRSIARSMIGAWLANSLFGNVPNKFQLYRKLKTSGAAHEWQKQISKAQFDLIDFNQIHGRALSKLVKSKFLKNQGLSEKYAEWIKKPETIEKGVKYTGYPHELLEPFNSKSLNQISDNEKSTIERQFETLVNKTKDNRENKTSFITVVDISSSMRGIITGTKYSSIHVAKSLSLFFSKFLTGNFKDTFIEFDTTCLMKSFKYNDLYHNYYHSFGSCIGSTNFQSVIDLFCKLKRDGINEKEFPTGILCISDGEFNPGSLNKTNVKTALDKLRETGFSKDYVDSFVIVLWNLTNSYSYYSLSNSTKFETKSTEKNTFYFGGFSPSTISFLINNKIETPEELFLKAMNQEILNLVRFK